jgi:small conductance mechanosensitive channel
LEFTIRRFGVEKIFDELVRQTLLFTPRLATALVVFMMSWLLGKIVQNMLLRLSGRVEEGKSQVLRLTAASTKVTALIIGCVTALGTMGINVTALVAGLGLSGFALGFALKDALSNFLAGALILIYRPFSTGNKISVSGGEGEVVEVNLRYTVLKNAQTTYLVPNSTLLTNLITLKPEEK